MKHLALFISAAAVLVAVTASRAQVYFPNSGWSLTKAEEVAGSALFQDHCASCHANGTGDYLLAPSLKGVVGRRAASDAGFPYSAALKNSGLTWTEDNLRRWIMDNANMVPNTLMPHVSIKDPAEAIYLVAYLKTQKAPTKP